jgi:hypothetical protein
MEHKNKGRDIINNWKVPNPFCSPRMKRQQIVDAVCWSLETLPKILVFTVLAEVG